MLYKDRRICIVECSLSLIVYNKISFVFFESDYFKMKNRTFKYSKSSTALLYLQRMHNTWYMQLQCNFDIIT